MAAVDDVDALIERSGHGNRSEAVRDLIRNRLIEEEWGSTNGGDAVATVTFRVDHIVSGVAVTILASGLTRYLSSIAFEGKPGGGITQSPRVEPISIRATRLTAVAGRLWPDVREEQAQASLRSALWRLRRTAPGLVVGTPSGLSIAAGVRVDVRELQVWAERVLDPRGRADQVFLPDTALRGDLLPGWYDDWVLL